MTIAEFAALIQRRLRDDAGEQWTTDYVLDGINAAFSALCHVLPQSYTEHRDLTLVAGTEQTIDEDLHRIVHMLHNKCPITGDAKGAIIKCDLSLMDRVHRHWRQDDPRGYIWHYMLNPIDESTFYVWPPATTDRGDAPVVVDDPGAGTSIDIPPPAFGDLGDLTPVTAQNWVNPTGSNEIGTNFTSNGEAATALLANGEVGDFSRLVTVQGTHVFADELQVIWWLDPFPAVGFPANTQTSADLVGNPDLYRWTVEQYSTVPLPTTLAELSGGVFQIVEKSADGRTGVLRFLGVFANQGAFDAAQPFDPILIGATPEEIAEYQQYLLDLEAYNEADAAITVRGVFTKTPCIYTGSLTEPVLPVDPGPVTEDLDPQVTFAADLEFKPNASPTSLRHYFVSTEEGADFVAAGGLATDNALTVPTGTIVQLTMGPQNPAWATVFTVTVDGAMYTEAQGAVSGNSVIPLRESNNVTVVNSDDARLAEGQILFIEKLASTWIIREDIALPQNPVTQQDVDDYNAALAQYQIDLAAYQAATLGTLQTAEQMPFDKAHFLPLQEFCLYYGHARDDEQTANSGRAMQHWQNFFQLMNKREDAELLVKAAEEDSE